MTATKYVYYILNHTKPECITMSSIPLTLKKKKYAIWILKIFVWDGLTCTGLPSALETPRLAQ